MTGRCPAFWQTFVEGLADSFGEMDQGEITRSVQDAGYEDFHPAEIWAEADLAKVECLRAWSEKVSPRLRPKLAILIDVQPAWDIGSVCPEDREALGKWLVTVDGLDLGTDPVEAACNHALGVFHYSIPIRDLDAVTISAGIAGPEYAGPECTGPECTGLEYAGGKATDCTDLGLHDVRVPLRLDPRPIREEFETSTDPSP